MSLRLGATSAALHAVLVLLAAVLVSAGTLGHGFVFDDHLLVGGNAPVILGDASLSSAFTYRYWGAADEASPNELYRPATILSLAIPARLFGQSAVVMHATNLLLHAVNALLVYALVRVLFGRPLVALLTGVLFAVHPIATEAFAPVAGRADLLATSCLLAAGLLALYASRRRGIFILVCGLGLAAVTFLGGLAKESAFVAPLLTVGVLGVDRQRHSGTKKQDREYLATGITLVGIQAFVLAMIMLLRFGILGYVYRMTPPSTPSTAYLAFVNNPLQFAGPLDRILTAFRVAVMGAGRLIFPLTLSADYSYDQIPVSQGLGAAELLALAFAAGYLALVLWTARRFPAVMFALSWSALTYLIVSNLLVPIGTIFGERLLYLPSIGFALLLAIGLIRLGAGSSRRRTAAVALTAVLIGLYAGRSMTRAADWVDDETLFRATVATSPRSAKAHSNRGFSLQRAGRIEEAIIAYRQALSIAPGLTGAGVALARCYMALGHPEEAIGWYRHVIEHDDGISVAWSGLGLAQSAAGHLEDAETSFRKALGLSLGGNPEAIRGLAEVMSRTHREEQAVGLLERLSKSVPGAPEVRQALAQAHYLLGLRRLEEGDGEAYRREMGAVLEIDPDHGPALFNLAQDALSRGDREEARRRAEEGLRAGFTFPPGFLEQCGLDASGLRLP